MKTLIKMLMLTVIIISTFACEPEVIDDILSNDPQFNMDLFEQNVRGALENEAVGFSYTINQNGNWVRKGANGLARTNVDGQILMSENTRINIASVSKLVTAIAAMKLIEQNNGVNLDSPIGNYFPPSWNPTNDVANITFRELLTQTSGLHIPNGQDGEAHQVFSNLKDVVETTPVGSKTYDYVNINFALFRVLIPHLAGPVNIPSEISQDIGYATLYENYIQDNILSPIGINNASLEIGNSDALLYRFPYDNSTGVNTGDWTLSSGAGGWYMSAFQMAHFVAYIWHSNELISNQMRDELNGSLLALSESVNNGDHGTYQAKGGGLRYSSPSKGVDCMVMNYPNGVQVSVICNSTGTNTFPLQPILRDAFDDAWE